MSTCFWPNRRACNFSLKLRAEEGSMKHSDNNFIEHLNRLLSSNSVAISFSGNLDHTCQNWFGKRVQKITRKGRESDMKNYCRNRRDLKKRTTSIGICFVLFSRQGFLQYFYVQHPCNSISRKLWLSVDWKLLFFKKQRAKMYPNTHIHTLLD